jgi:transposase-like protein
MKYSKAIVKKIVSLIEQDTYTILEICSSVGISRETYHTWIKEKPDFSDSIKRARGNFEGKVLKECEKSLVKLITGYEIEETKTVAIDDGKGKAKIKEKTVTKKFVNPSLGAIIHYQTNRDPENWKNRQSLEHTGKDGDPLGLIIQVSSKEQKALLEDLDKSLNE